MNTLYIGTSGYSYTDWKGPVYPEHSKSGEWLELYSNIFNTVELNFSFYRMPDKTQLTKLAGTVQKDFLFSIKANDRLTHQIDPLSWREAATEYRHALEGLQEADKLGAVLLQFPYSFKYEVQNRRYLSQLLLELEGLPLAVEFRNIEWCTSRVLEGLRERQASLVWLDMPQLKGLPPVLDTLTAPFAYLRFHGRNRENWWGSDSAARYDYLYNTVELKSIQERVKTAAQKAPVFAYFNNHRNGQAVQNAKELRTALTADKPL